MAQRQLFVEVWNDAKTSSTSRVATVEEIESCQKSNELHCCYHGVFYDEPSWLYDFRFCGVCGALLGMI